MKKDTNSASIEHSAERVERVLSKCKLLFLYTFLLSSDRVLSSKLQSSSFFKIPRMPVKMNGLQYRSTAKKKTPNATYSPTTSDSATHLFHEYPMPKRSELSSKRVIRWKLKEYQLASRRLKGLQRQIEKETLKSHEITHIMQPPKPKDDNSDQQKLWQDLLRSKEERQFQITRIIKYLADI